MPRRTVIPCGICHGSQLDHVILSGDTSWDKGYANGYSTGQWIRKGYAEGRGSVWMCCKCVDKMSQETFVKVLAIDKFTVEVRGNILSFVQASAMREQCRNTWRWFVQGADYTTNDIYSARQTVEEQMKYGIVWRYRYYRTSSFFRSDEDLLDRIIEFLVGRKPAEPWSLTLWSDHRERHLTDDFCRDLTEHAAVEISAASSQFELGRQPVRIDRRCCADTLG